MDTNPSPLPANANTISSKEITLAVLALISHVSMAWFWKRALPMVISGDFSHYFLFIIPIALLVVSASLFSFAALFIRNRWVAYTAILAGQGIPYLLLTAGNTVIGGTAATLLLAAFALRRIRKEFLYTIGFSAAKILKAGVPLYLTASALTVSFYYIGLLNQENAVAVFLPRPALDFTLNHFLSSQYAKSLTGLPDINRDSTVNEVIDGLVSDQLKNQGVALSKVPAGDLSKLRNSQREEMSKQFGTELRGEEKIGDVFYMILAARVEDLLGPYKIYLPYISGIAFFFAFKTLTLPLYFATLAFVWLLILILRSAKVIHTTVYQIEIEKPSL